MHSTGLLFFILFAFEPISAYKLPSKLTSDTDECPFNEECTCSLDSSLHLRVSCGPSETFPTFAPFNASGLFLELSIFGTFTVIPKDSIFPLYGSDYMILQISGQSRSTEVDVDPDAFFSPNPPSENGYFELIFYQYSFPTFPIIKRRIDKLEFLFCAIPSIDNKAFEYLFTEEIDLSLTNTSIVEDNAFADLGQLSGFTFAFNPLQNISKAFKSLKVVQLDLSYNEITEVQDYAFVECENFQCVNYIQNMDLSSNPITAISDYAFANLISMLTLDLDSCLLTVVPSNAWNPIPNFNLISLNLANNEITIVEGNAFYKLSSLSTLSLDNNPITVIEPGAFNGLKFMENLELSNLYNLTSIDILATYGMASVVNFNVSFSPNLHTILLTDYTKIPSTLKNVSLSLGMNVINVDPEVQHWLGLSEEKTLDISFNHHFDCNPTIQWMAKYALCTPKQIYATETYCSGKKEQLITYLQSFKPACAT